MAAADETYALWQEYRKSRDPRLRDRVILSYAPLVKFVAGRVGAGEGGEPRQEPGRRRQRERPPDGEDDLHYPDSGRGSSPRSRAAATASSRLATPSFR